MRRDWEPGVASIAECFYNLLVSETGYVQCISDRYSELENDLRAQNKKLEEMLHAIHNASPEDEERHRERFQSAAERGIDHP